MPNKWIYLCILILTLTGCVDKEILDDVSLESGIGFDYQGERQILGTSLVPSYQPDKSIKNVTHQAVSAMNRELIMEIQRQSADPLVAGSIEVVLFGKTLAQKGIIDLIDALQRDSTIGERIYLVVVDGKANDLLKHDYGTRGNATYISNLIMQNIEERDLPKSNLHMFIFNFFQEGKDGFLPSVRRIGKDKMEINGVCLFKNDKVVDFIPASKMFFFKLLTDEYSEGTYKVELNGEEAAVRSITSTHRFDLTKKKPWEITIHITVKGQIREYSGDKLSPKAIKQIEKNLEKKINAECLKLIHQFKKQEIDPIGLGNYVKSQTRGFDTNKWKREYQNLTVKFETKVEIIDAGVIE
ncbi:Ger(x)C family spore germination protein [Bacillus marasmi]|uniref:Ger(x)C family spore germination protein n=1 Tax=Bacillus marasmi TaxID=1926279 RepID=UPI0011C8B147|nr:Ger(x)C family spore germination protein [Bacillus marasmi]